MFDCFMACTAIVDQLRGQEISCKSAEDWLSVTRACEAKLQTASAAHRCEQLSPLYCHAFQVVTKFVSVSFSDLTQISNIKSIQRIESLLVVWSHS